MYENDGSAYGYPIAYTLGAGFIGGSEYMRQFSYQGNDAMQNLMMFYSIVGFVMMIFIYINQRSWDHERAKYSRVREKQQ